MKSFLTLVLLPVFVGVAFANIRASIGSTRLELVSEDVEVDLRAEYAHVTGIFSYRMEVALQDRVYLNMAQTVDFEVPVFVPSTANLMAPDFHFPIALRSGGVEPRLWPHWPKIEMLNRPDGIRVVLMTGIVPRPKGNVISASFEYDQPYIGGVFYYLPILGRELSQPASERESRDTRLRLVVRSPIGAVLLAPGSSIDAIRQEGALVVFPRHLHVVAIMKPERHNKSPEPTPGSVTPRATSGNSK